VPLRGVGEVGGAFAAHYNSAARATNHFCAAPAADLKRGGRQGDP
jgi:hypothetical protein